MAVGLILNEIWKSKWKLRAKWTQDDNRLTVRMPVAPPAIAPLPQNRENANPTLDGKPKWKSSVRIP